MCFEPGIGLETTRCPSLFLLEQNRRRRNANAIGHVIAQDQWVVPALRQFQEISKTIIKHKTNKSDRTFLHDLNKAHELLKLAVNSMARCHQAAVESSRNQGSELNGNTLVDERYKHSEVGVAIFCQDSDFYPLV